MKKYSILAIISLFLLVSCGQNNVEKKINNEPTTKIDIQSKKVTEPTKIEASSGTTSIENSGSSVTSSGELTDTGSDEVIQEIDNLINEISKEK